MDDVHTTSSLESLVARSGVKDGASQSQIYQHRIEKATTVTI